MLAWTAATSGQTKRRPVVIGWLHTGTSDAPTTRRNRAAFVEGMVEFGWKEGAHYIVEGRFADGKVDRLAALADDFKARGPAVIVTTAGGATRAAAMACPDVPIIQAEGGLSPVDLGLAQSLARPGGMVTGLTNIQEDVSEKYVELLLAAVPSLQRIGYLVDRNRLAEERRARARRAAEALRIEVCFAEVGKADELEAAIASLAKQGAQGLVVLPSSWFGVERERIMKAALRQRWPAIASIYMISAGALLSYGVDAPSLYRRAAWYVDRILKGTKPGDLPIEQPTKFELVVNLQTAKTLGITIPQAVLVQATRVIE